MLVVYISIIMGFKKRTKWEIRNPHTKQKMLTQFPEQETDISMQTQPYDAVDISMKIFSFTIIIIIISVC